MKIALVGYGKMGKAVEKIAIERKHLVVKIDSAEAGADFGEINSESISGADVCVDFTNANSVLENAKKVAALKKNLVIGTTGWYDKMDEMKGAVRGIGCLWSGNFSIGMNVFFRSVKETAKMMNNLPEYDAAVYEVHHNQKKDSPGGSAQIIGKIILENMKRKKKVVMDRFADRKPNPDELHVASVRCGSIPGTHTVLFDCPVDTIEMKHIARGREGFAFGAVLAAEFIKGKKGFYSIDDLMNEIIKTK
ncbi:MAG: 4-hydroxy-tetrahydrodipicolinate reductase [Candidatus Diapherotrites archaeon]|nr:4-hydroxy-tetrahydrodipicolinate reductase [Candidatus Diapherotrites archaeon]